MKIKTYDYESIFKPIVFLLIGILLLTESDVVELSIYVAGILLFLIGIFKLFMYYKKPDENNKKDILYGTGYIIVSIVAVLLTLLAKEIVKIAFRYVIAAFLLYTGVVRLINALKKPKNIKLVYIISSILIIVFGILLAVFNLEFKIVGLIIIVYAIIEIVGYILNHKYKEENSSIKEALIVKEKEE